MPSLRTSKATPAEDPNFIKKIEIVFDKYETWYIQFQSDGLKPELAATRKLLFNLLNGLFVHLLVTGKNRQLGGSGTRVDGQN